MNPLITVRESEILLTMATIIEATLPYTSRGKDIAVQPP